MATNDTGADFSDDASAKLHVALSMYQQQNTRWNQWALFFFGSLIALFTLWSQIKDHASVPFWIVALIAALLSLSWICAGQCIRADTSAWRETLKECERRVTTTQGAFAMFEAKRNAFSRWDDFLTTVLIIGRQKTWRSLTRILMLLGALALLLFLVLAYCTSPLQVSISIRSS